MSPEQDFSGLIKTLLDLLTENIDKILSALGVEKTNKLSISVYKSR